MNPSAVTAWKTRVANSFDQAAAVYEQRANIQRRVADRLSTWILERVSLNKTCPNRQTETISDALEIGCGTGFLTRKLVHSFPDTNWTITDLAPRMLERCRESLIGSGSRQDFRVGGQTKLLTSSATKTSQPQCEGEGPSDGRTNSKRQFQVLDGEAPDSLAGSFDLICSNLTFQWFTNLERGIAGLMQRVRPGGWLCFTTLDNETFSNVTRQFPEWKFPDRFSAWPNLPQITQMISSDDPWRTEICSEEFCDRFDDLGSFLHSLKSIGAATAWQSGTKRKPSRLRDALRRSRASNEPVEANYQVLFVAMQKRAAND